MTAWSLIRNVLLSKILLLGPYYSYIISYIEQLLPYVTRYITLVLENKFPSRKFVFNKLFSDEKQRNICVNAKYMQFRGADKRCVIKPFHLSILLILFDL
jgi:hypothetical protein